MGTSERATICSPSAVLKNRYFRPCSRGPIGKFLEQFKDSLSGVLREHFLVVHLITYRKFSFLISIAALPPTALPRQVLQCRLQEPLTKAWISLLETQISNLNLPNLVILLQNIPSKSCWKKCITKILGTRAHLHLLNQVETKCDLEQLSMCAPNFSSPSPLWKVTHCPELIHLTWKSNFRIRLLLGCHGLESDASRFSTQNNGHSHFDPILQARQCSTWRCHSFYFDMRHVGN